MNKKELIFHSYFNIDYCIYGYNGHSNRIFC